MGYVFTFYGVFFGNTTFCHILFSRMPVCHMCQFAIVNLPCQARAQPRRVRLPHNNKCTCKMMTERNTTSGRVHAWRTGAYGKLAYGKPTMANCHMAN